MHGNPRRLDDCQVACRWLFSASAIVEYRHGPAANLRAPARHSREHVAIVAAQQTFRQNRWAQYEHEMQDPMDDPPDAWEQTEFAFARLRFRSPRDGYFRRFARWGTDSNKSDRLFMKAIRRLTRIHTRSDRRDRRHR